MNILFNPAYILKPDNGRVLLLPKEYTRENTGGEESFDAFIHPIHAIILNSLTGDTLENSMNKVMDLIKIDRETLQKFLNPLIDNEERVYQSFNGVNITFPERCIIQSQATRSEADITDFFNGDLDLRKKKHHTPTDITLMINNLCATDCVYCYADRRTEMNAQIPFERIEELIVEARRLHARSFDVIGGEFFLYRDWERLLICLRENGFDPFLSTKIPMTEKLVTKLKAVGVRDIQVSLDSLIIDNLCSILKVKTPYFEKIKRSFELLNKYQIKTIVHTILNSHNDSVADMRSIHDFLKQFDNIDYWKPDLAGPSLYLKEGYEAYKPETSNLIDIVEFFDEITEYSPLDIRYGGLRAYEEEEVVSYSEKQQQFTNRGLCSGNFSSLFILPDGKVTICEELYWHEKFIMGNVLDQSLNEIWNSPSAHYLSRIPQEEIAQDSPCSVCEQYYQCREIKQICWRDTLKGYGTDKWYYPDVRCPKAPTVLNPVTFY